MEDYSDQDKYSNNGHQRGKKEQKVDKDNGGSSNNDTNVNEEKTDNNKNEAKSRRNSESDLADHETETPSYIPGSQRSSATRIGDKKRVLHQSRENSCRRDLWERREEAMPSFTLRKRKMSSPPESADEETNQKSVKIAKGGESTPKRRRRRRSTKSVEGGKEAKKSKKGKCETPGECNCGTRCRCRVCSCGKGLKKRRHRSAS